MIDAHKSDGHPLTNAAELLTVTAARDCQGWIKGTIGKYTFSAKVYDLPSTYGINNGRVSKLGIYDDEQRRRVGDYFKACIVNYDRGWDIRPDGRAERGILKNVLTFLEALPLLEEPTPEVSEHGEVDRKGDQNV